MTWKYVSPRRRLESKYPSSPTAKASDFLADLPALLESQPGLRVVLYCRKSSYERQQRRRNLAEQASDLREEAERLGANVLAIFRCWECSYELDYAVDRSTLVAAAEFARRHRAVLVAETTDRFLRHPEINRLPTVSQYEKLRRITGDVALATLVHPDDDGRSHQTKRGQRAKGRRGGRPPLDEQSKLRRAVYDRLKRLRP